MGAFESLIEANKKGEIYMIEGGYCHWHLRRDGQLTIREILSSRPGAGQEMLARLKQVPGATFILAKCPTWYDSNDWYKRRGFILDRKETTRGGSRLNIWIFPLASPTAGLTSTPAEAAGAP